MNHRFTKLAAVGCLAAGIACAQAAGPGAPARGRLALGGLRQRVLNSLGLNAGQKAQAKSIMQQARKSAEPVRTDLQESRKAFQAAVKNNDASQIQGLSAKVGQSEGQLMAIRGQAMAQIYALLTPDQRTKLDQMEQRLRQRMQQRRSNGQPGATSGN